MRIPSEFTDDNLYRRGVGRRERFNATRRLVRLGAGLVLVVVLMQQASRPEIYRSFFAAPLQRVQSDAGDGGIVAPAGMPGERTGGGTRRALHLPPVDAAESLAATAIAAELSPEGQQVWLQPPVPAMSPRVADEGSPAQAPAAMPPDGEAAARAAALATALRTAVEQLDPRAEPDQDDWLQLAAAIEAGEPLDQSQLRRAWTLRRAVLQQAIERVVDGSVWQSDDHGAFYAALAWPTSVQPHQRVRTGVLPLLQQPEAYRGQSVSVVGQVVRSERLDASENDQGIAGYWRLWMHLADGSERPMLAIVASLPASLQTRLVSLQRPLDEQTGETMIPLSEAPHVQIDGVYLKRLAYRSHQGADLAPVVVGAVVADSEGSAVSTSPANSDSADWTARLQNHLWSVMSLVILVAVLVAATIMVRTGRAHARIRALRAKRQDAEKPFWRARETAEDQEAGGSLPVADEHRERRRDERSL